MRKIKNYILAGALLLSMVPVIKTNTIAVNASVKYTYYSMHCSGSTPYEVDTINDNGTFDNVGCYVDFNTAVDKMNASGPDAVVRHDSTNSANQIIAMNRGFVFSAGFRNNASPYVNVYQYGGSATTYVNNYHAIRYEGTLSYDGNGDGSVRVNAFGFDGTVSLNCVDFVPQKFFDQGLAIWSGGNDPHGSASWYFTPIQNYYTAEQNGNYRDAVVRTYSDSQYDSNPSSGSTADPDLHAAVGQAPAWMQNGVKYYTLDDVNFYSDTGFTQYAGTYYNYYLFSPLRTRSYISADVYNGFIENAGYGSSSKLWNMGSVFINDQNTYGINAALTFVQGCLESTYGTSDLAMEKNNLFGVQAYDTDFGKATAFDSPSTSIDNQMGILLRQYSSTTNSNFFGGYFGNKGAGIATKYASSSTYGLGIAAVYYSFDKYANGYNGNLTDFHSSCLGFLGDANTNIYSNPSESSVLYTTSYGNGLNYYKNFVVSIVGEEGNYYKVQSTDYLSNGRPISWSQESDHTYDWNSMIGYVRKSDVQATIGSIRTPNSYVSKEEMYRMYNPNSGEHFYTRSDEEREMLIGVGWTYEGVGWNAPSTGLPVYRLYNANGGEHHYTMSTDECDMLVNAGWLLEGVGWYSDPNQAVPLYRQYNPNAYSCNHNYTASKDENDWLVSLGWTEEGIGWYGVN